MATVFLIGNPSNLNSFSNAEMVLKHYGHTVINPLDFPDVWDMQKFMIDSADAVLMLPGWEKSDFAARQHSYSQMKNNEKKKIIYSLKNDRRVRKELQELQEK